MSQNKILYLSYDGILEPLGYSQVFKYVEELSKDFELSIVSFEKTVDLKNHRRLIRALEVCKSTQKPYSSFLKKSNGVRFFESKT